MRLQAPTSSRPLYYDRNPSDQTLIFISEGLAPHASTQRAIYTVPTDNKAYAELSQVDVNRSSAAGTPETLVLSSQITPSGGAAVALQTARLWDNNNTIGDRDKNISGTMLLLLDGDAYHIDSGDGSTTGTVDYEARAKLTEFDA